MKSNICIAGFWVIAIIFVRATNEKTKYKTRKKQKQKTGRQVTSRLL